MPKHETPTLMQRSARNITYPLWGCSSVGRALEWHSRGQEFNSPQLHQIFSRHMPEHETPTLMQRSARNISYPLWGCSSVGRALEWHSRGQEFNSPQLHQKKQGRPQGRPFCLFPSSQKKSPFRGLRNGGGYRWSIFRLKRTVFPLASGRAARHIAASRFALLYFGSESRSTSIILSSGRCLQLAIKR